MCFSEAGRIFHDHHVNIGRIFLLDKIQNAVNLLLPDLQVRRISKRGINSTEKPFFRYLVKKGIGTEIVFLADGVILVVMAFGALKGEGEKCLSEGIGPVSHIF
ncbi:hypothetical protein D9M69_565480 [compost metagenome]